jgi:hypothetical protein
MSFARKQDALSGESSKREGDSFSFVCHAPILLCVLVTYPTYDDHLSYTNNRISGPGMWRDVMVCFGGCLSGEERRHVQES